MIQFTFSKGEVQRRLEALPATNCVAFALSCCERMFPNYVHFKRETKWGDERPLRKCLDELWKHMEGQTMSASTAGQLASECEVVEPDSDDFSSLLTGPAQEACFSICCILDYIQHGNIERIAQSATFSIDTLDLYVQEMMDNFSNECRVVLQSKEREDKIRLHPLMQRELARQDADLILLASKPDLKTLKSQWRAPNKSNIDLSA